MDQLPTNRVPKLPPGQFFRVVKEKDLYTGDHLRVQLRAKRRLFGSRILAQVRISTKTEKEVLYGMRNVMNDYTWYMERCAAKQADDKRINKLLGDYPPKKIIK